MRVQVTRPAVTKINNRYRVRWSAFGKQRERRFDSQRLANRFAEKLNEALDRGETFSEKTGEPVAPAATTVSELAEMYLQRLREVGKSDTTLVAREHQVSKICDALGGEELLTNALTRANMVRRDSDLYAGLTNRLPRRAALVQMCELAFDLELVPSFTMPKPPSRKKKDLITPDWHELYRQIDENCVGVSREIFLLMMLTGMRPGEVCALRDTDVTREGDQWKINVAGSLTPAQARKFDGDLGPTKTRRDRTVFVSVDLWTPPERKGWLFPGRSTGAPYHQTSLNTAWKRAGLPGIPYTCRHVFHTFSLASGVPVGDLAVITGNTPETIFRYYVGQQSEPEKTSARISDAMRSNPAEDVS